MNAEYLKSKNGFTLLEILVAIALFAAITAMLYPTYIGTLRNMDITESYGSIYRMARIATERISGDLQCAAVPDEEADSGSLKSQVFSGKDSTINGKDADELEFLSEKHISFDSGVNGGRGLIRYYVKEYEDQEGFILYRSDTPELGTMVTDDAAGLILCEGLSSINISYQDENGDTYDYWDSSSEQFKNKLPSMVSFELVFVNRSDPESPIKFTTSVSIPISRRAYGSNS